MAAPVTYTFCIKSDDFATFKAIVAFRSVDFGESAAKQMVINRVKPHLESEFDITLYAPQTCVCEDECPVLEVKAEDWAGGFNEAGASTMMGSAAESLDMIFYSAQEMFNNPGSFIKKTFFGGK